MTTNDDLPSATRTASPPPADGGPATRRHRAHRIAAAALAGVLLSSVAAPLLAQTPPLQPRGTVVAPLAAPPAPAEAPAPAVAPVAPLVSAGPRDIIRAITLSDLGYSSGIELNGLIGRRELFFPLPRGLRGVRATLRLAFDSASGESARRSVRVMMGDRTVFTRGLSAAPETDTIDIPIDLTDQVDDFVRIQIVYGGALTDDYCIDQRVAGDFFTLLPETGLVLSLPPDQVTAVRTAVALMPRDITIYVPPRALSEGEVAAALGLARALGNTGHRLRFAPLPGVRTRVSLDGDGLRRWARARQLATTARGGAVDPGVGSGQDSVIADDVELGAYVLSSIGSPGAGQALWTGGSIVLGTPSDVTAIARAADGVANSIAIAAGRPAATTPTSVSGVIGSEAGVSLTKVGGVPVLILSGDQPETAARFLGSIWEPAADSPAIGVAAVGQRMNSGRLLFKDFTTDLGAADVVERAIWNATFSARELPPDTRPVAINLNVAVADDSSDLTPVVSAFVNDRLMASARTDGTIPTRLSFGLPEGLAGLDTNVRVVVQRSPVAGECKRTPQGYPAQLLPTSEVKLGPALAKPRDFYSLVPKFGRGVDLNIAPLDTNGMMAALPLLAEVARTMIPTEAPIRVRFAATPAPSGDLPFISFSPELPPGATPPVRFDAGRVRVTDTDGTVLLDASGFERTVVAQVVEGGGQPGLWLHFDSGTQFPAPRTIRLDQGDVAFIDTAGVSLSYSSVRDSLVSIDYPDAVAWTSVLSRFRGVIFGAIWLAATVLFVLAMARIIRRRRSAAKEAGGK